MDSVDQLQGYKGGVLRADFGNATVRNPYERGPWFLNENISLARTFGIGRTNLEFRLEVFNLFNRVIWGSAGIDDHQRQLRQGDDAGERAAADAARVPVRILSRGRVQCQAT